MSSRTDPFELTPDILLRAYSIGLFPMAEGAEDDKLFWVDPKLRGVFPLDGDGSDITRSWLTGLREADFDDIELFVAREGPRRAARAAPGMSAPIRSGPTSNNTLAELSKNCI